MQNIQEHTCDAATIKQFSLLLKLMSGFFVDRTLSKVIAVIMKLQKVNANHFNSNFWGILRRLLWGLEILTGRTLWLKFHSAIGHKHAIIHCNELQVHVASKQTLTLWLKTWKNYIVYKMCFEVSSVAALNSKQLQVHLQTVYCEHYPLTGIVIHITL